MGKDFFSRKSKHDDVYTPYSMTEQFLKEESFDKNKTILEPACGVGAIIRELIGYGFDRSKMFWSDIKNTPISYFIIHPLNFLEVSIPEGFDLYSYIITNPPFSKWDQFVNKAKQMAKIKFAFLGRLEFLTGIDRFNKQMYQDQNYPLTKVYIFVRKANLIFNDPNNLKKHELPYPKLRQDGKYPAGMYHYAWFMFENKYYFDKNFLEQPKFPAIKWINNQKYILKSKDML